MKVAVVTPTIGSSSLHECISSVKNQTYSNLTHYIFIDGYQYAKKVKKIINRSPKVKLIELEENVGKDWYGHRVYAASSFLVNADIICYLDEDNWYDPNHIEELVKKIESGAQWAYSLRKVYDKDGNYLCDDNCESLGEWSIYLNNNAYLVDTSSFAIRRDIAVNIGHVWYGKWGTDRKFLENLKKFFPNFACTGKHSLCYRLDGNSDSVKKDFFDNGNKITEEKCQGNYPWHQI